MVRPLLLAAALLCCVSPAGHALPQARVAGPTAHDLATLVELGAVHGGLALSPDGAYVAVFERRTDFDRNNYDYALVVVPTGGGAPRTLADAGGFIFQAADGRRSGGPLERDPVWSPDSQWIAFIAEREGRAELWRAHVTSGRSERIAALDGDVADVVWLADGSLLEIARGITEHKQTEQNIALLNFALDNVREAAFLIDENAHFCYVNEESCRVLGYTRDQLLSLRVTDIDPDFPFDRWRAHWDTLKTQPVLVFESRHRARDGRIFPVEVNANYFEYEGREYNLALVRDITTRKQAEQEHVAHDDG